MDDSKVLAERFDGLAYVVMRLVADLEMREMLDGARFCAELKAMAAGRRNVSEVSASTIEQFATRLDDARETRSRAARKGRSRIRS